MPAHGTTAAYYTYDYFIKDHLGNTRVVLTEQNDFSQYMATMEQQSAQKEDSLFYNLNNTREAKPLDYPEDNTTTPNAAIAKLNGSDPDKRIGPSIILKVMAGDTIQAAVRAFYRQQVTKRNNAGLPAEQMLDGLVQALVAPAVQTAAVHNMRLASEARTTTPGLTAGDLQSLKQRAPNNNKTDKPKAYLNYVFFDKQLKFVGDGSGVKQVDGEPNQLETLSSGKVVARQNGYVYVYTSNESTQDVLFDNFGVEQISGPVLEETHYYPFGLTMSGISTVAPLKLANNYKFNSIELNEKEFGDGTGLDLYTAYYRSLDPQIGRWWQIDPKQGYSQSPYAAMLNNPIFLSDPLGDTTITERDKNSVGTTLHGTNYLKGITVTATRVFPLYDPLYTRTFDRFNVHWIHTKSSSIPISPSLYYPINSPAYRIPEIKIPWEAALSSVAKTASLSVALILLPVNYGQPSTDHLSPPIFPQGFGNPDDWTETYEPPSENPINRPYTGFDPNNFPNGNWKGWIKWGLIGAGMYRIYHEYKEHVNNLPPLPALPADNTYVTPLNYYQP